MNQGPAYYGDLDEVNGGLLEYEREAEDNGTLRACSCPLGSGD
jgi:pre-mRNA-splicing factor ISY1